MSERAEVLPQASPHPRPQASPQARRERLRLTAIGKSFPHGNGRLAVLEGLDLTLRAGEFVALVGPSGCGKSTLLEILCGLQRPDSGTVEIDGVIPVDLTGKVAYMPQDDLLFPWRRIIDNVTLPLVIRGMPRAKAREKAGELFPLFGLSGFEEAYPAQLSGGMRQRAALLRTWVSRPDIVALDEPFGALDAQTRKRMQDWLVRVWQEFQSTVLLVTHDVDEALALADRVVVLSQRPARVAKEYTVAAARPRSPFDPELLRMKEEIYSTLADTSL